MKDYVIMFETGEGDWEQLTHFLDFEDAARLQQDETFFPHLKKKLFKLVDLTP